MYRSPEALPDFQLTASGGTTYSFLYLGLCSFREAADYVQRLPYGRTTDRADYKLVLKEGCGTCSTKHALLADLTAEHEREDVLLTLGIYEMSEHNTPGVAPVLHKYRLQCIPEAHCYLTHAGNRVDLTLEEIAGVEPVDQFLHEQTISPGGIGEHKVTLHKRFLAQWSRKPKAREYGWRELLNIREECIASLSSARS